MLIVTKLRNQRLSIKILLVLSTVIAIMTVMATQVAYNGANDLSVKAGSERIIEEVSLIQAQIQVTEDRLINDTQYLAQDLAINEAVGSNDLTAIQTSLLLDDTTGQPGIDHVVVVGSDGNPLVILVDRKVVPVNASPSDELLSFALLGIPVSGILEGPTPILAASAPVQSNTGEIVGAVQIGRRLDDGFLQSINFARPGVNLALINPNSDVIAVFIGELGERLGETTLLLDADAVEADDNPQTTFAGFGVVLDYTAIDSALNGEVVYPSGFSVGREGHPLAIAYVPFVINYDTKGVLAIMVDLNTLNTFRDDLVAQQIVALALIGLLSAIILALMGWYFIALPLGKLQQATHQLARGDYSPQPSVHGKDELGQLATAFTEMANTLHDRDQQIVAEISERTKAEQALRKANDELEKRVAQRTSELRETNERLQTELVQREQIETQIRTALQEKDVLLKEIHHRVKNNMQVMSSLLRLQSSYTDEAHTVDVLRESQHRVQSMALVHERLYQSPDLAGIAAINYVRDLVTNLAKSYHQEDQQISLDLQVDELTLDIDTAIPCGLILNELVSNAIKHAFPNQHCGVITIRVKGRNNRLVELVVGDDGIGIAEDIDFNQTKSLGLQLVTSLSHQLEGTVEIERNGGTTVRIRIENS